jgi:hypothetical protein
MGKGRMFVSVFMFVEVLAFGNFCSFPDDADTSECSLALSVFSESMLCF